MKLQNNFTTNKYASPDGELTRTTARYPTPRKAFAALIDKVSGKGTWDKNPLVFVYEFELIK